MAAFGDAKAFKVQDPASIFGRCTGAGGVETGGITRKPMEHGKTLSQSKLGQKFRTEPTSLFDFVLNGAELMRKFKGWRRFSESDHPPNVAQV